MQTINKVTVRFGNDLAQIGLYKSNVKIASLTNKDLGIENFEVGKHISKNGYLNYCREIAIDLLENGGIKGFQYKETKSGVTKYNKYLFKDKASDVVCRMVDEIRKNKKIKNMASVDLDMDMNNMIISKIYKDGSIKYGEFIIFLSITNKDGLTAKFGIKSEIRSGQLCKPKTMLFDEKEYNFNVTNINKIMTSL